jgi:hypothetical protein
LVTGILLPINRLFWRGGGLPLRLGRHILTTIWRPVRFGSIIGKGFSLRCVGCGFSRPAFTCWEAHVRGDFLRLAMASGLDAEQCD